jgi:hypothetical protein
VRGEGGDLLAYSEAAWRIGMVVSPLNDLVFTGLSEIYSAEKQLTEALPRLARAATNSEWQGGFLGERKQTQWTKEVQRERRHVRHAAAPYAISRIEHYFTEQWSRKTRKKGVE